MTGRKKLSGYQYRKQASSKYKKMSILSENVKIFKTCLVRRTQPLKVST